MRQQSSKTGNVSTNTKTDYRLKNYRIRVVNLYVYAKLFNLMQKQTNKQKKKSSPKFKIMLKGLGAIRAKIGPTSDVDKIFSKMYSQYVLFINKYS
jgi:hypothetical protein